MLWVLLSLLFWLGENDEEAGESCPLCWVKSEMMKRERRISSLPRVLLLVCMGGVERDHEGEEEACGVCGKREMLSLDV